MHKQPLTVSGNARQIELYKRKQKIAVCPNHLVRNRAGHRGSEGVGTGEKGEHLIQLKVGAEKFSACTRSKEKQEHVTETKQTMQRFVSRLHALPFSFIISPTFKCVTVPRPPTAGVPTLHPTPESRPPNRSPEQGSQII